MQIDVNGGYITTPYQTSYPGTKDTRIFNMKEANSTGNCITGNCTINNPSASTEVPVINNYNDKRSGLLSYKKEHFANEQNTRKTVQMNQYLQQSNEQTLSPEQTYQLPRTRAPLEEDETPIVVQQSQVPEPVSRDGSNHRQQDTQGFFWYDEDVSANNAVPRDFFYNSKADWRNPTFNEWTRTHEDSCEFQNQLLLGAKPMKYYTNQVNSPQVVNFSEYTLVGNQKSYNVRNEFERPIPSRLNPLYPVSIEPYSTTPSLGLSNVNRTFIDTDSNLRWNDNPRNKKSQNLTSEVDYNRYEPITGIDQTVQNAGQFGKNNISEDGTGYYNMNAQNNVIMYNSALGSAYSIGVSTRDLLRNELLLSGC